MTHKKIKIGKSYIQAFSIPLASKNFILLRGNKGYVMCGYLNMAAANKFSDLAIKIFGVSSIEEALEAKVSACSSKARKLGISKGQKISDILKFIV